MKPTSCEVGSCLRAYPASGSEDLGYYLFSILPEQCSRRILLVSEIMSKFACNILILNRHLLVQELIMIKHYSNNIQNIIQKELFAANNSIKICVAWFTNDLLFQPLLLKLNAEVKVELILNKDDINLSNTNEIDFDLFIESGGHLYLNESNKLLHHKFCIIDDNVVISGSYNWTNGAEHKNYELITLFKDEAETTTQYLAIFEELTQVFPLAKVERKSVITLNPINRIEKKYDEVGKFVEGLAIVCRTKGGEHLYGLINERYEEVAPCKYSNITCHSGGFAIVTLSESKGIIDKFGKPILPCCYDKVAYMILNTQHTEKYFLIEKNGKCGVFTSNQTWIIEIRFDSIYQYSYCNHKLGVWIVKENNKWGIRKHNGKLLTDCIYDEITPSHKRVRAQIIEQRKNHPLIESRGINKWDYIPRDSVLTLATDGGYVAIDLSIGCNIFEDGISPTFDNLEGLDKLCKEREDKFLEQFLDASKCKPLYE